MPIQQKLTSPKLLLTVFCRPGRNRIDAKEQVLQFVRLISLVIFVNCFIENSVFNKFKYILLARLTLANEEAKTLLFQKTVENRSKRI